MAYKAHCQLQSLRSASRRVGVGQADQAANGHARLSLDGIANMRKFHDDNEYVDFPCCADCKFFDKMGTDSDDGACTRHAPMPFVTDTAQVDVETAKWPFVDELDLCGEYKSVRSLVRILWDKFWNWADKYIPKVKEGER